MTGARRSSRGCAEPAAGRAHAPHVLCAAARPQDARRHCQLRHRHGSTIELPAPSAAPSSSASRPGRADASGAAAPAHGQPLALARQRQHRGHVQVEVARMCCRQRAALMYRHCDACDCLNYSAHCAGCSPLPFKRTVVKAQNETPEGGSARTTMPLCLIRVLCLTIANASSA